MKHVQESVLRGLSFERAIVFISAYFAPVLAVFTIGAYFNNSVLRDVVSYNTSLSWVSSAMLVFFVVAVSSRFLSELSNFVLSGFRHLLHWFGVVLYKISGILHSVSLVKNIRKRLHASLVSEDVHVNPIQLFEYLDSNPYVRRWYINVYIFSTAMQSAFGAFTLVYFFYQGRANFEIGLFLILFFLATYIAKHHFHETERKLFVMMNG